MIIVLMGPPGCGKGTISSFLSEQYNFCHISTGDLIRKEIKDGGDFARKINEYVLEGKLVPDEITNEILKKNILSNIAASKEIQLVHWKMVYFNTPLRLSKKLFQYNQKHLLRILCL